MEEGNIKYTKEIAQDSDGATWHEKWTATNISRGNCNLRNEIYSYCAQSR